MDGNLSMANKLEYIKEPEDYILEAFPEKTINELGKLYQFYWDLCSIYGTVNVYDFINFIDKL